MKTPLFSYRTGAIEQDKWRIERARAHRHFKFVVSRAKLRVQLSRVRVVFRVVFLGIFE